MIEQPFGEPWQARAFAMVVRLHERGLFSWPDWTAALVSEIAKNPQQDYYASWLSALQSLAVNRGALTPSEIDDTHAAWLEAAKQTPHGQPITLDPTPGLPHSP
jgi:nitrile hydratase accessory protein